MTARGVVAVCALALSGVSLAQTVQPGGGSAGGGITTLSANAPAAATDAKGIVIGSGASATLQLEYADGTHPGIVSTTTQTFAGAKTFSGAFTLSGAGSNTAGTLHVSSTTSGNNSIDFPTGSFLCFNGTTCTVYAYNPNGTGLTLGAGTVSTTGGISSGGIVAAPGVNNQPTSLPTCGSSKEGFMYWDSTSGVATSSRTRLCLCTSNGSSSYAWQNVVSGTVGSTTACSN